MRPGHYGTAHRARFDDQAIVVFSRQPLSRAGARPNAKMSMSDFPSYRSPQPAGAATAATGVSMSKIRPDEGPGLTGLRFLTAFSVLIAHAFAVLMKGHDTPGSVAYWVAQGSGLDMTPFFVLSGFVIHYNYATLVTAGGFRGIAAYLWARFARLYPLFLLMLGYIGISRKHYEFWTGHPRAVRKRAACASLFPVLGADLAISSDRRYHAHLRHRRWFLAHLVDQHRVAFSISLSALERRRDQRFFLCWHGARCGSRLRRPGRWRATDR